MKYDSSEWYEEHTLHYKEKEDLTNCTWLTRVRRGPNIRLQKGSYKSFVAGKGGDKVQTSHRKKGITSVHGWQGGDMVQTSLKPSTSANLSPSI